MSYEGISTLECILMLPRLALLMTGDVYPMLCLFCLNDTRDRLAIPHGISHRGCHVRGKVSVGPV